MDHKTNPDSNKAHPSDQQGKTNPKSTKSKDNAQSKGKEDSLNERNVSLNIKLSAIEEEVNEKEFSKMEMSRSFAGSNKLDLSIQIVYESLSKPKLPNISLNNIHALKFTEPEPEKHSSDFPDILSSSRSKPGNSKGKNNGERDQSQYKIEQPNTSNSSFKDQLSEKQRLVIEFLLEPDIYNKIVNRQIQDYLLLYKENKLLAENGGPERGSLRKVNFADPNEKDMQTEYVNLSKVQLEIANGGMQDGMDLPENEAKKVGFALGGLMQYSAGQTSLHNLFAPMPKNIEGFTELPGSDIPPDMVEIENICNGYLPICVFLSVIMNKAASTDRLIEFYNADMNKDDKDVEALELIENTGFLEAVFESIVKYNEKLIYSFLLESPETLDKMISQDIFSIFHQNHKFEFLQEFFESYEKSTGRKKGQMTLGNNRPPTEETTPLTGPSKPPQKTLTYDIKKFATLAKFYFLSCDDPALLLRIFKNMKLGSERILETLLHTKEDEKVISLLQTESNLLEALKEDLVLDLKAYKLLILLNKKNLINTFNLPVSQGSKVLVYHEMCSMIERGESVESMTNIIIHVSETFWDYDKLIRFFRAVNMTVRNSKSDWLLTVQNPLLFCIALVDFFKKLKEQLDYKDNEINDLSEGMLNFCKIYIESASYETLNLNLLDKDTQGIQFLDYAFQVQEMSILETDQIAGLIYQMWDLKRHTMQTLDLFMRILTMNEGFRNFTLNVFIKDFSTPIEEGDCFQLDFRYGSNSVKLKVLSEILWPILIILAEFIFSMQILQLRLRNEIDDDWVQDYVELNPWFFYVLVYLRATYIVNCLIKSLAIKSFYKGMHYTQVFYYVKMMLVVLQCVVYPLFLPDHFWFINLTQTLFVLTLIAYVLFNALSLNDVGVILRIFFRMGWVVIIFGTVSCFVVTIVAYPIHTIFVGFSQPIEGQIYKDLNLFEDLYQGIMTCFEFVFGAVVLVRPYVEENLYTYSMTIIMMLFAFFGNIMLANMLVAFLTSSFDHINQNATYLTMNMQFGLIKVFKVSDKDTLVSLPYPLLVFAFPFFLGMIGSNRERRKRFNHRVRVLIHICNIFLPTLLFNLGKLLLIMVFRYLEYIVYLVLRIYKKKGNLIYLISWILGGLPLLIKLLCQDVYTMCRVMLNIKDNDKNLLDFELDEPARSNLIGIFSKFNRIINYNLRQGKIILSYKQFMDMYFVFSAQEFIVTKFNKKNFNFNKSIDPNLAKSKSLVREYTQLRSNSVFFDESIALDFNGKYKINEKKLAPILLRKFAFSEGKNDPLDQMKLDMNFMSEKLRNNINHERIVKLISFDKDSQIKASRCLRETHEEEIERGFKEVREGMSKLDEKLLKIVKLVKKAQTIVNK